MLQKILIGAAIVISLTLVGAALNSDSASGSDAATVQQVNELNEELYRVKLKLNQVEYRATAGNNGAYRANQRLDSLFN